MCLGRCTHTAAATNHKQKPESLLIRFIHRSNVPLLCASAHYMRQQLLHSGMHGKRHIVSAFACDGPQQQTNEQQRSCCNSCCFSSCVRACAVVGNFVAVAVNCIYLAIASSSSSSSSSIGMQSSAVHGRAVARNSSYCEAPTLRSNASTSGLFCLVADVRGGLP